MESLRRLTSSIFDSERLSLGRRGSISSGILSPTSEAAAHAAQGFAPSDLDITFITNRLIVMGFPVQGPTDKKRNQNNIDDLAEYLEMHHSNQYMIFNLNSLENDVSALEHLRDLDSLSLLETLASSPTSADERKQTSVIAEKVRQQMVEFAWERDGMKAHTPPFDHIFRICYAIFAWLSLDASNVALINCQTGKTRSGIVVASYLLYARLADDPIEAFVEFYRKRWGMKSLTSEALRQKTPQSIQRFLTCFHDLIDNQRIPNDKPIVLKGIIIRSIPVEFQPCIQIWDDHRLIFCTSDGPPQADHSPVQDRPAIDWECEDGCLAILWDDGFDLDGGFSIMCSFGEEYDADDSSIDPSTKVLFRYADSTWFLAPGLITLTKSRLDIMKQYEDAFNDEYFAMDLVFVESKKPQRKYIPIDYTGNAAVRQGVIEITKQHVVLPDPGMHSNFMKMGFSDAATTFALQRSQNAPNIALDILHSSVIATCFRQDPKLSGRTRPALQSYSSASILGKQQLHGGKTGASEPLVRRQSTAEIAALQSQRAHHNTPVAEVASVCIVCKDDDYIMRPQIVRCRGACGNVYHTTCVGLRRIPFGLTTLSDRTNHSVYVKKYFNAWECDSCAAAHLSRQQDVHPHEHQSVRGPYAISSFSSRLAQTTLQTDRVRTTVPAAQHSTVNVTVNASDTAGDGQVEKLMDFLAVSGVSVEDLLRAATTANVAISPSGGATELSKGPNASDEGSSPSSGTLHKLVDVQENPQDSAPNSESAQPVDYKQKTGSSRICPSDAPRKQAVSAPAHEAPASGRSFLLADIAARTKCKGDEQIASANEVSTPEEAPSVTLKPASTLDPKAALLAQIATRSQRADQEPRVDLQSPQTHEQLLEDSMKKQEAVRSCTTKDRVDPGGQATLPVTDKKDEGEEMPQAVPSQTKLKDMQEFSSYFNMLRIGCPKPAVTQKMLMDGMDPVVLELGPDALYEEVKDKIKIASSAEASTLQDDIKSVKSYKKVPKPSEADQPSPPPHEIDAVSTTKEIALKDHETYSKYFKMLKMGLPEDAVRHKIQRDGLDDRALILGGDAPFSKLSEKPAEIRLADDPVYSKYFKMLKMGLPKDAVCHKMALESVDARALELGPDAFVSQLVVSKVQTASSLAKTKVRRKKLHWQPISDDRLSSDRHTIWEDKDDDGVEFDMDMDEIESLFFASSDRGTKKNSTVQSKAMKRKQSVTLIDGKRAMNAAISLARVKLSYAEIAHAISVFDAKGLTVDQLRGIREFLPTAEEAALVTSYSGDVTLLGEAEKFIMEISNVKRYTVRAECLLFRISFASKHEELSVSVGNLIDACQQVKESRLLKTLLGTVLKLGNTLNGSGDDNEIRGFTVDSLLRLGHTKAVNQKTTVLHYLIRLLKKNHPAVLDFQSELKNVALAARESFEAVDEDFGKLQSGLTLLSEEFQELQKDEMDNETVVSLQAAVEDIGGQMELLDQRIKHARDEVQSVLEYFGEDPAKNLSSFFTTLASFCSMFETARKEVDTADEAQQRAERMKLRRNASLRPSPKPVSSLKGVRIDRERAMSDRGLLNGQATPRISENDVA